MIVHQSPTPSSVYPHVLQVIDSMKKPKTFIVWTWSWQIYMYSKTLHDLVNKLIVFHEWEVMISKYHKHGTNIFYHTLYRHYCLCGKSVVTLSFTYTPIIFSCVVIWWMIYKYTKHNHNHTCISIHVLQKWHKVQESI